MVTVMKALTEDWHDLQKYAVSWFDDMAKDEAMAVETYGEFATLLEEGARKYRDNPVVAQLLAGTAINLGQIIVDEQKHQSTFIKLRHEFLEPEFAQERIGGDLGGRHGEGKTLAHSP